MHNIEQAHPVHGNTKIKGTGMNANVKAEKNELRRIQE